MAESTGPWLLAGEPASLGDPSGLVTLVEGQAFCLCGRTGDILPRTPQGVFFADVRVVSGCCLTVDGDTIEPLAVTHHGAWSATVVGRPCPTREVRRGGLLVLRHRSLGLVLREVIEVRNYTAEDRHVRLGLDVACDFADVFAVKEGRADHVPGERHVAVEAAALHVRYRHGPVERQVRVAFEGGDDLRVDERGARWTLTVPARSTATVSWGVAAAVGSGWVGSAREGTAHLLDTDRSAQRFQSWTASAPVFDSDHDAFAAAVATAVADVGSLRLFDPDRPDRPPVIAAGAPWFLTLFGRDALLTGLMALPVDPGLALGVVQALADLQGDAVVDETEEEPGRILHETRFGVANSLSLDAGSTYYGTADATPLFVVLIGELSRWGLDEAELRALLPHADRAIEWIERFGDRDGDGWVEYERRTERGLQNQGWKDSWDGVRFHDGTVAEAPIALVEVQGYVYAAYRARAEIARRLGDDATSARCDRRADDLRARFTEAFWCPERGWYAMGLDGANRRIDALASNAGHCLWSGVVPDHRVDDVVCAMLSAPMWSGFGVRTLASDEPAFDPLSYHCGSVWPHDNAVLAMGLARCHRDAAVATVALGLIDASDAFGGRLPELFCGLDRDDVSAPVPFPTSCSPQAWAAAAPLALVRAVLGFEPDLPNGVLRLRPRLPEGVDAISWRGVRLFGARVDVEVRRGAHPVVFGVPHGVRLEIDTDDDASSDR